MDWFWAKFEIRESNSGSEAWAPKNFAFRGRLMPELVQALHSFGEQTSLRMLKRGLGNWLRKLQRLTP